MANKILFSGQVFKYLTKNVINSIENVLKEHVKLLVKWFAFYSFNCLLNLKKIHAIIAPLVDTLGLCVIDGHLYSC